MNRTDCHRANNGGYDRWSASERFAACSSRTRAAPWAARRRTAHPVGISDFATFVENTLWAEAQVTSPPCHVVGSNNSLVPCTRTAEERR